MGGALGFEASAPLTLSWAPEASAEITSFSLSRNEENPGSETAPYLGYSLSPSRSPRGTGCRGAGARGRGGAAGGPHAAGPREAGLGVSAAEQCPLGARGPAFFPRGCPPPRERHGGTAGCELHPSVSSGIQGLCPGRDWVPETGHAPFLLEAPCATQVWDK